MFYYLKGKLALKDENFLVLDICGVGFKIFTSQTTLSKIGLNSDVMVYTYTYVREDALDVFGFCDKSELDFFQKLISVSGVGPRLALAILSTFSPEELVVSIFSGDAKRIARTPGVGPKLAQRMILELKDKIKNEEAETIVTAPSVSGSNSVSEAASALVSLGYGEDEAKNAISSVETGLSLEETIKKALLYLMR